MDDLLLKGAAIAALVVAFAGAVTLAVPEEARFVRTVLDRGVCFASLAPIAMLGLGLHLRRRELRAQALLRLLEGQPEVTAADLLRSSDFNAATLDSAVRADPGRRDLVLRVKRGAVDRFDDHLHHLVGWMEEWRRGANESWIPRIFPRLQRWPERRSAA